MIVNRTLDIKMENHTVSNDVVILYKPKSDFINLTIISQLEVANKEKTIKRRESEETGRTSALKGWIWEKMVGVMDIIANSVEERERVVQTADGEIRMIIRKRKYSMGWLTEEISLNYSVFQSIKRLSEEDWGKVCMAPGTVPRSKVRLWWPEQDPRPEWLIQREERTSPSALELPQRKT